MGKVMKLKSRGPSKVIANAVLKKRAKKEGLKNAAQSVEAKARASGGYGTAVISIHKAPKGGILKSPAYKKLLTRCEVDAKGKPPAPEDRDGAPIKGGFPVKQYPVNVVVDALRASWLPDDWAQVMKNTGPGGVYHGWMSPEGKFFYHRKGYPSAIEETLGRKLTVLDGLNGMMRAVRKIVPPGADKKFHQQCLTAAERKHIAPAKAFHFGVVSGKRANIESGQHDIMVVEGHFKQIGIKPTWYVDAESLQDYKKLGLNCKVGGKLVPARNMVLDDAKKANKVAVEISDDISKWIYYDCGKQNYKGETDFKRQNKDLLGIPKHCVSPLAAAQFILAKMRADPDKPKLGGVFPTANAAMTLGSNEFGKAHFILGDFFVAEPSSKCRFDPNMTLKEDYDYTCSHLKAHGSVLRCNRFFLQVKHATNAGGAVEARDKNGQKERDNIAILQKKWPGVFRSNGRRKGPAGSEVTMNWNGYGKDSEKKAKKQAVTGKTVKKAAVGKTVKKAVIGKTVKKFALKSKAKVAAARSEFPLNAVIQFVEEVGQVEYINNRCKKLNNKTVEAACGTTYTHSSGAVKRYGLADLRYDINRGSIRLKK